MLIAVLWQQWLYPAGLVPTVVLGLSVWLVYTADHWLDAHKLPTARRLTVRHRFAAEYARPLVVLWLTLLCVNLALALNGLSRFQLASGCVLLALCSGYIASVQLRRHRVPKALIVAVIFAAGAGVFQLGTVPFSQLALPVIGLFLLAFANCSLIASKEMPTDKRMGFSSPALRPPARRAYLRAALLTATVLGVALALSGAPHQIALSVCACALGALDHYAGHLHEELFHQLADAALLLPVLFLPV